MIYAEKRGRVSRESAFFEFFLREVSTTPPPARPIYPRGGDPSPSAPGRTAHDRQQRRPCQMQGRPRHAPTHTPGCWTRCTGLHSIPDRPRWDDRTGCGALEGVAACPKLCRFGQCAVSKKSKRKNLLFCKNPLTL